ncbi:amidohydrolase family protein [Chloroflexota bacterium]
MKIDVFAHILPKKYLETYGQKNKSVLDSYEARNRAVSDLDVRLRLMDRYPDVLQVLTISQPPLEQFVKPNEAVELARIANDELAELVDKYPDKFVAAVACLPMNDMDAALEEADRAITQLRFRGVQIYSRINGEPLDNLKFKPLYEKMANHDLPIWIHPTTDETLDTGGVLGWPFETASAMYRLVLAGTFNDYPNIKFITHHCGSMVPYFEKRIKWSLLELYVFSGTNPAIKNQIEHFRKFYNDTALYGCTAGLMCAHAFFGADRLLFGTDAPLGPKFGLTGETIESIERMDIPDFEKEKIFTQNAVNLLSLPL